MEFNIRKQKKIINDNFKNINYDLCAFKKITKKIKKIYTKLTEINHANQSQIPTTIGTLIDQTIINKILNIYMININIDDNDQLRPSMTIKKLQYSVRHKLSFTSETVGEDYCKQSDRCRPRDTSDIKMRIEFWRIKHKAERVYMRSL